MSISIKYNPQSAVTHLAKTLSSTVHTDQFLDTAIKAIAEAFCYGGINLFLLQKQTETLSLQAALWHGLEPSAESMATFAAQALSMDTTVNQALKQQEACMTTQNSYSLPSLPDQTPIDNEMAAPLWLNDRLIGILHAFNFDASRLSVAELALFQATANQLSLTIESARMHVVVNRKQRERSDIFHELQNRLSEVSSFYTLSQKMVSILDLDELLNHLVTTLRIIVDCRACVIFLLDDSKKHLEIKAADGVKPEWEKSARLKVGQGAAGQSVKQRKTIYIRDTKKDPEFIFFDRTVRSLIVVPMIHRDKAIGAINLDHSEAEAFGQVQERLLSVAAAQAAISIENAILFKKLSSDEQRTRAIIRHMADGLLMIGPNGIIESVNPRLARMLELRSRDIIGQDINDQDMNVMLAAICAPTTVQERTGVLATEVTLPEPNLLVLRVFASTVADKDGNVLGEVRIVHDVTKDRALENMKDELMSTVSHELRTPLFSIRGFVHLLLDEDPPEPDTQREFLTIIARETDQLADMVTNLLDSNQIAAGIMEIAKGPVQPVDLIDKTLLKLQGFAHHEHVNIIAKIPPELPEILGDQPRLEQVLTNLVGNAIKFTPAGGSVTLGTHVNKDYLIIVVTDTGIGISSADIERIFTKFYQAEETNTKSRPGSGLGLHISKQLIEKHGGEIWVESQLDRGSSFFIKLPIPPQKRGNATHGLT